MKVPDQKHIEQHCSIVATRFARTLMEGYAAAQKARTPFRTRGVSLSLTALGPADHAIYVLDYDIRPAAGGNADVAVNCNRLATNGLAVLEAVTPGNAAAARVMARNLRELASRLETEVEMLEASGR